MDNNSTFSTGTGGLRTPNLVIWIVGALLAGPDAESKAKNLRKKYPGTVRYIDQSALEIGDSIAKGMVAAFDFKKVVGEAILLFVFAFWGAPLEPRIAATVVALVTLRLRDAYVYYLVGSAGDAATDGLVMIAVTAMSQVYLLTAYPPAVLPALPLVQGIAFGMLLVVFWRLFCQLQTPFHNPQTRPEFRVFSSALRINFMFCAACVASLMVGIAAVPDTGQARDGMLGLLLGVSFFLIMVFKKNFMGSLLWGRIGAGSILANPIKEELERKKDALPTPLPARPSRGMIVAMRFQLLSWLVIGAPVEIAVWRWAAHSTQPVIWPLVGLESLTWIALAFLWTRIKELNSKAVSAMGPSRDTEL